MSNDEKSVRYGKLVFGGHTLRLVSQHSIPNVSNPSPEQLEKYAKEHGYKVVIEPEPGTRDQFNYPDLKYKETEDSIICYYVSSSLDDIKREVDETVYRYVDYKFDANRHGYEDLASVFTYLHSKVDKWREEAQAISDWRDDCYLTAYDMLNKAIESGEQVPKREDIIAALPQFPLPEEEQASTEEV